MVYMLQFTCLSPCGACVHVLEILRGFMSWDHCASTQTLVESHIIALYLVFVIFFACLFTVSF